jgi:hypothetical protein
VTFAPQIQSIKFGGDYRLRYEYFDQTGLNRRRFRYRLRLGADTALPYNLLLGLRFATGTGEQVSTNQSFDNLSSQKAVWFDQAYLRWNTQVSPDANSFVAGGRLPNPLWRLYSSDLLYDEDYVPEGFGQGGEWLVAGGRLTVFANALQAVMDEDSGTPHGQWLFAEQLGAESRLPMNSRVRVAGSYNRLIRENRDDFAATVTQEGNRRKPVVPAGGGTPTAGTTLANRFGTAEVTGQISTWVAGVPVALQGTYAKNVRSMLAPKLDKGYQGGVIVGRAKAAKSWEAAWFRKRAEADVALSDLADSDFGNGGTNRKGNIFWVAVNPQEWMQFKVKYFDTKRIDPTLAPAAGANPVGRKDINRLQMDVSVKF